MSGETFSGSIVTLASIEFPPLRVRGARGVMKGRMSQLKEKAT